MRRAGQIATVRRAALALALANPADDPWRGFLKGWLADAQASTLLSEHDDSPLARVTLNGVPQWFVSVRDVKLELGAYRAANVRRVRGAMKSLGLAGAQSHRLGRPHHWLRAAPRSCLILITI